MANGPGSKSEKATMDSEWKKDSYLKGDNALRRKKNIQREFHDMICRLVGALTIHLHTDFRD